MQHIIALVAKWVRRWVSDYTTVTAHLGCQAKSEALIVIPASLVTWRAPTEEDV